MTRRSFVLGAAGTACSRTPRLNVLNWSDYVAPETIPGFEREFGVRVRYGTYESAEEMLARVMSGNSGWDVVFPPNSNIRPMRDLGLLAPLDHSRLPGLAHLAPGFRRPLWDPELQWCVPYMWGATGILYNRRLSPEPRAWSDLWRKELTQRVTMLDDPADVIGACLKKLGLSVNSENAAELERARQEALLQKPFLRAYANEIIRDQVVAGEILAAQVWRSTAMRAFEGSTNLAFQYPTEGYPIYADNIVVLRESACYELAHAFVDYLLRPRIAMRIAEVKLESTVNASARALLPAGLRNHPILYPNPETLSRGEWLLPLSSPAQKLRDRIWTEIKSA